MGETETQQININKIRMECENRTQAKECQLNKGLIFIKAEDIILTLDKWTIAVNIETEDFDFILAQIEELFNYLRTQDDSQFQTLIPTCELSRLRTKLQTTRQQVANLKLLLPSRHTKRGLVNGLGTVLNIEL